MIDLNKPITNPELVEALREMQNTKSTELSEKVIHLVLNAKFLAPVTIDPAPESADESGKTVIKKDSTINFSVIESKDKKTYFPAFTDWDELKKWRQTENQQTFVMSFDDYSSMVVSQQEGSDGFVINPYGENVIFEKATIQAVNDHKKRRLEAGATVSIGQPREYPEALVNAITEQLKTCENVKAAYLQLMIESGKESYLIILDFTGDREALFDQVANSTAAHLGDKYLSLTPFDSDFGRDAAKDVEPFYVKQ